MSKAKMMVLCSVVLAAAAMLAGCAGGVWMSAERTTWLEKEYEAQLALVRHCDQGTITLEQACEGLRRTSETTRITLDAAKGRAPKLIETPAAVEGGDGQ